MQVLFINLYFSRKVRKFLHGLCPDGKMSAIGKYPRNAIGYTPNIRISLRFNTLFMLKLSKVVFHSIPSKVQSLLNLGRCYAGVLQPVQLPPQPLHHLLHQQCHEVSPQVKSQTIKMVIGQVHLGGAVLHHLQHSSQPQGLTNLTGASSQGTLYSF